MLWKDCVRLGKISIKSRKKSTRNTVRGISFGLIMLIPVVYFTLAFYVGLLGAFNASRATSCFRVETVGRESTEDAIATVYGYPLLGKTEYNRMYAEEGKNVEEIIYNEYYAVNINSDGNYVSLGGVMKQGFFSRWNSQEGNEVMLNETVKIVESGRTGKNVIPAGINDDLEKKGQTFLLAGEGFSEDARGQVLISETMAEHMEISPEAAVGQPFSVFASLNDEQTVKIIGNFTVVGVISEDYYRLENRDADDRDAHVWISGDSVYEEKNGVPTTKYLPDIVRHTTVSSNGSELYSYEAVFPREPEVMAAKAEAEKFFFPAYGAVTFYSFKSSTEVLKPVAVLTVQCKDYASARNVGEILNRGYGKLHKENSAFADYSSYFANRSFTDLTMLHRVSQYVMAVLYTFGGIVFFATLLNLYNSVNYSVQVRRNYLGMMRAVGARKALLPRLYFVEILLIFARSFPWVLVFGGGICYGIKALIDVSFGGSQAAFAGGVAITLKFWYFFPALAVMVAFVFLIAWLFSRIACLPVTKKPVLEVLSDEK